MVTEKLKSAKRRQRTRTSAPLQVAPEMAEFGGARLIGRDVLSLLADDPTLTPEDLAVVHRAQLLVNWLTDNALSLSLPKLSPDLRDQVTARIERTWTGFFGSFKGEVMVLMDLIDAIQAADEEDAPTPTLRAHACRARFSTWYPEHAARLELSSIESTLLVWRESASGGAQTGRWKAVNALAREAGLTPPAAASISRVWRSWRAAFRVG